MTCLSPIRRCIEIVAGTSRGVPHFCVPAGAARIQSAAGLAALKYITYAASLTAATTSA